MTKAIDLLYDEHQIITQAIEQVRAFLDEAVNGTKSIEEMHAYILFFRHYADKFHHYKEEEILFPEMAKRNELIAEGVIQEMLDNHVEFRQMIADMEASASEGDAAKTQMQFAQYAEALLDHIAVENDEVFQMAESLFSDDELENMYFRFVDMDRELNDAKKREMEASIQNG
ncbi:MAG: hemerythrin domain-containing protein [Candidatus Competibacteraceae bacterium]|nr:hemerythrin domain-containing protein [Candidatus Competibacteraceae bacterium]